MKQEAIDRFRSLIEDRLHALSAAASGGRESARPVELDQSRVGRLSRQDALQAQALSAAAQERGRREIGRLRAALRRIGEGDYGWCEECGGEIAHARLEIDPAAEFCIICARRREGA